MAGKTKQYETVAQTLEGRSRIQVREVTRELRRLGLWPRDGTGGGKAAHEVPIDAVVNRMLGVGAATLPGIGPYLDSISATQFTGMQHDPSTVVPGSRIDQLLARLAVKEPAAGNLRQARTFIRGADLTLHETVARIIDAICVTPEIGDELDALQMSLELITAPPPFEIFAVIWLSENGQRFGWNYLKRNPKARTAVNETLTRVFVRSVKIPAIWFREYAALLSVEPNQNPQEEAA